MTKAQTYWRSLAELEETPEFREFLHREFPVAASEFPDGISRRRWLQLMGASLALGGLSGCRWPTEKIVPLTVRPENRVPGEPQYYATSVELAGAPQHLLVTCVDGRPIKVEGNPQHPGSGGATDRFAQASLLGLYDPDRSDSPQQRQDNQSYPRTWAEFEEFAKRHSAQLQGAQFAILVEPSSSLSLHAQLRALRERFPQAQVYVYEAVSDEPHGQATAQYFGRPLRTQYRLSGARIIAAFDADLLGRHPDAVRLARDFSEGRNPESGQMNRLYAVESQFSITGAAADHRLPVRSSDLGPLLARLRALVARRLDPNATAAATSALPEAAEQFIDVLAEDLAQHAGQRGQRGQSLVAVGPQHAPAVQIAAIELNSLLDNTGRTVVYTDEPRRPTDCGNLAELVQRMQSSQVRTLLILGGNPVYTAPADLQFADALAKVETSIHLSLYVDETSRKCQWHLPQAHPYEAWGDVRAWDGTLSISQPLIEPLLNGKSALEVIGIILGQTDPPQELVRKALAGAVGQPVSDAAWKQALHDGFVADSQLPVVDVQAAGGPPAPETPASAGSDQLEVVFQASQSVDDGRFANNGWLQEMPQFLSKLTWDNAAIISPQTAARLGLQQGSLVRVTLSDKSIELPVFILPGQAPNSIGLTLGYGRTAAGHVGGDAELGIASVGVDVNPLRTWQNQYVAVGAQVEPLGSTRLLATTQDHHAIDRLGMEETGHRVGELVREATLEHYRQDRHCIHHGQHEVAADPLWTLPTLEGQAWGMAIDLNRCIGCNACVTACQAENNVPIVGKEQVARGREMHWLRVDRYFTGDVDNPQAVHQPVACHHCETAPCEQVCPVAATVHSTEGLNDMVYNRCIGTRYCANNCPYKVRRFNFFNYRQELDDPSRQLVQLVMNPEVTVRSRGVMEKCTYCVQRIQAVKIDARNERRTIADGEIVTACQQACPTRAIEFGDLNKQGSRVAQAHASPRSYGMLAELNVKPRTRYLARIRNPHPRLSDAETHTTPESHGAAET